MKNYTILILSLIFCTSLSANDWQYPLVDFYNEYSASISEKMMKNGVSGETNVHKIIPLGWSRDGKFAYITQNIGVNIRDYKLIIQNLITDKFIYESDLFESYRLYDSTVDEVNELEKVYPDILAPEFYYLYNKDQIEATLHKYSIRSIENLNFKLFPFTVNNKEYQARINVIFKESLSETGDGYNPYDTFEYNVEVFDNIGQRKIIHTEKMAFDDILDYQVIGCIKSPFEDRVAVIIGLINWNDYSGNEMRLKIIGCDLNSGFDNSK